MTSGPGAAGMPEGADMVLGALPELARRACEAGLDVRFAASREALDPGGLTPGEAARFTALERFPRREEWLRGRAALKELLRGLGMSPDTSALAFPHPRVSLTHSAGVAVAAGLAGDPDPRMSGIGVDYEAMRPMRAGTVRFYLADAERAALGPDPREGDLLRLWTVKEALFKANPGNREGDGRYLAQYVLDGSPYALDGTARAPGGLALRYVSQAVGDGFLSLAVAGGAALAPPSEPIL